MIAGRQNKAVIIKKPTHSGLLIWLIPKFSKYFCHFKLSISQPAGAANHVLEKAIKEANDQGAFVFWNHPHWESQRRDGIARLDPIHDKIIRKKYLKSLCFF